jgi:hypothetical protein
MSLGWGTPPGMVCNGGIQRDLRDVHRKEIVDSGRKERPLALLLIPCGQQPLTNPTIR